MSAAKNNKWEVKASREKDTVYNVLNFDLGVDGSSKSVDYVKVVFIFKASEVFMVTTAVDEEGGRVVAFDSADSPWGAILKWSRKVSQNQHVWRVDKGFK